VHGGNLKIILVFFVIVIHWDKGEGGRHKLS